jgi:D-alanyl-D-alanine carboxypeptidase (penicillin-binding protein 5/6)
MLQPARRALVALAFTAAALSPVLTAPALARTSDASANFRPTSAPKYAAIVIDANSGEVLYENKADSPRYPASISKVMTMYLAFEALSEGRLKLTDQIVVSPRAASMAPTKLGLRAGETINVDDALRALAVQSANDMAVAVAEKIGGTETRFAALMTLRGQELGMTGSRFVNASGLPDSRQISTARDIATLSRAVMRDYPQYYSYFSTQQFSFRGRTMRNHNGLLGKMPGVDGLKTGFTNASGFNLSASAVRDGRRLIAVVLGGSSTAARDGNVEDLLLTGFDVLERRAHGDRTASIAGSVVEPSTGRIAHPPAGQGDAEQRVQMTSNPVKPGALTLKSSLKAKGRWGIQVGSFKQEALATKQIRLIEHRFGSTVGDATGAVQKAGGGYRAQFKGLDEADARDACKTLKAQRQVCMVVSPG